MKVSTWFLPPSDPRRVAEELRQMRLIRLLEWAAKKAGIKVRPKQ